MHLRTITCLMALSIELLLRLPHVFPFTRFVLLDLSANITGSQPVYHLEVSRPCLDVE